MQIGSRSLDDSFFRVTEMAIANPRDWENPSVFNRNKCRAHVPLRAHTSPESALRYFIKGPDPADNTNILSLNNADWSFHLYDRPENVPESFKDPDFDDGNWGKVVHILISIL